jgi:hypothetical protein
MTLEGATSKVKENKEKGFSHYTSCKNGEKMRLIDNELCRGKMSTSGEQFHGKKERSRKLDKTVIKNVAFILSNVTRKIPESITVNHPENVGVVTTVSKTSKNRKTCSHIAFTNTTKQSATTLTKVLNFECFEHRAAMVSHN